MTSFLDYHENLPPRYKKGYELFERRWLHYKNQNDQNLEKYIEEFEIFKKFGRKYFLTPELLHHFKQLQRNLKLSNEEEKILHKEMYFFDYLTHRKIEHGWSATYNLKDRMLFTPFASTFKIFEKILLYPNNNLRRFIKMYKIYSAKPLKKAYLEKCEKMALLSENIIDLVNESSFDIEKWDICMKEMENDELRIHTMEYFFSKPPDCTILLCLEKSAWKYYIKLLKTNDQKVYFWPTNCSFRKIAEAFNRKKMFRDANLRDFDFRKMLDTYSKYCRFFIEDSDMIEEYRSEIERIGLQNIRVSKWWIDTIKFEKHFGTLESSYAILERAVTSVCKKPFKFIHRTLKNFPYKFSFYTDKIMQIENAKISAEESITHLNSSMNSTYNMPPLKGILQNNRELQHFSLPKPLIFYILKNSDALNLQKLFETCKLFFYIQPTPVCYRLMIARSRFSTEYFDHALCFNYQDDIQKLRNLCIFNFLKCTECPDRKFLSKMIPQIYECRAKYISVKNQDLTVTEYEFLTKNAERKIFKDCNIFDQDGSKIDI